MSLNHIATPLDSAVLDSKEQYVFYHKMVDFVLKEAIVAVQAEALCTKREIVFFKQYCDLLLYSIEAMRIKYMYDEEDKMKVDLTDSGFPNYLEFRYLFNDLSLKDNYIDKLKNVDELKSEFLDTLMRQKKEISRRKLYQAASIVYYTSVQQKYIFNRFVQGKIIENDKDEIGAYMTSWSFYDVSYNRPFICFMYFDYSGRSISGYKSQIYEVLKATADRKMALDTMAYGIDRKLTDVHPKRIKRIDLGPLHNVFAKDENQITHALLSSIASKEVPLESFALSLKIDEVSSGGQFTEGTYFSKQTLQKWTEKTYNNYLFAPHRTIQLLYNKTPEIIDALKQPPIEVAKLKGV